MKAAHNVLYMKKHTNVRFISYDGHQLYDFKERGVDLEVEDVRYNYRDTSRAGRTRTRPASFKERRSRTRGRVNACHVEYVYESRDSHVRGTE